MTPELKYKVSQLNEIIRMYQRGLYSDQEYEQALAKCYAKNFRQRMDFIQASTLCGKPHNNAEENNCIECQIIKKDI